MTQLTAHFSLEELLRSNTGERLRIDNTPSPEIVQRLLVLAQGLEKIRALLGAPLSIDSGYRCPALNRAVGGVPDSAHVQGYAADFVCPVYGSPLQIARAIAGSGMDFDQVIQEGTWVHVSFAPAMRHQALTATFTAAGAKYSGGV